MKQLLVFIAGLLVTFSASAQITKFKMYSIEQGICNKQIYAIHQDLKGFVWLGTGEGLCRYDGFNFVPFNPDSVETGPVSIIEKDNAGLLWIGYQNGSVFSYNGSVFTKKHGKDDLGGNKIVGIFPFKGAMAALTQNRGMVWFKEDGSKVVYSDVFNQFFSNTVIVGPNDKLLVGTFEGLYVLNVKDPVKPIVETVIPDLDFYNIQSLKRLNEDVFLAGTREAGLFKVTHSGPNYVAENWNEKLKLDNKNIQHIFIDDLNDIWLSTFGNGVLRLVFNKESNDYKAFKKYDENNGLGSSDIKVVFQDHEGNYWVGTYNDGLACLTDEGFRFFDLRDKPVGKNITAVAAYNGNFLFGGSKGILRYSDGQGGKYTFTGLALPDDHITTMHFDGAYLWIGTSLNGLYRQGRTGNMERFDLDNNSLSRSVNHITGTKEALWVSTKNGIYLLEENYIKKTNYSTNKGLPHNNINSIFIDDENNAWVACKSNGLCYINPRKQIQFVYSGMQEIDYIGITKDKNGDIWAATVGYGVVKFEMDSLVSISMRDGLRSNYCYSIIADKNSDIWVGHRLGISRIRSENNSLKVFGADQGIFGDCNMNAIALDPNGEIIFGSTEGAIMYNPSLDRIKVQAPNLNFTSIRIYDGVTEKEYSFDEDIILPYKKYRLRIEFIGLSYKSPESVRYQYMLEGFDADWSDLLPSRVASYGRIVDGAYVFKVKACNAESLCSEIPLTLKIKVKKPFWKTFWFIGLVAVVLVTLVILIIKARERQQKALQIYLQKRLDERTREVVKQKEEIELKNRDITDSINYAQRIQTSILPSIKHLQQYFAGCFVYYQPRDIVSGDFYWFGLTKNNKFVIVCADSTGHGVPGAFMSMIGTILIKDICAREDVVKPSEILFRLDLELSNTLNQNLEAERSNDGMDIIVCEIDIKTYYTRIASAMRPVIVYQNGQQVYVKGSRNSVGGHVQKEQKVFENEGFQLSKGDLVYMFSDGYPDQFGGPMEKKFKMVRLKNLIKDMHQKPMDDQFHYVKDTFNNWKEGLEQVDDVLFMGIKI